MTSLQTQLNWIESQRDEMLSQLSGWCEINTGTYNTRGLARQHEVLEETLAPIADRFESRSLPVHRTIDDDGDPREHALGDLLLVRQRPESERTVLLGAHMDTVFGPESSFQSVEKTGPDRLAGPGVTDDKGGIMVLLTALRAFERTDVSDDIGWEVFVNPDEEIGSPGSGEILKNRAKDHDIGLVFEPPMPDGTMITRRKGSGDFTAVVEGQSAHAGRNPDDGRDAVRLLSSFILELHELDDREDGIICNVGRVAGGGSVNIVPDQAVARLNIRVDDPEDQRMALEKLEELRERYHSRQGFDVSLQGEFMAPPKLFDDSNQALYHAIEDAGDRLNLSFESTASGGITDGNKLSDAGLPTMDTMGPVGGNIHTTDEYLCIDSLIRRAKLTLLVLHEFARGELLSE